MSKITMKSNTNLTFDEAFAKFIRNCEIKNLTEKSIRSYEQKIRPFKEFLDEEQIAFQDINKETIDDFILWVRKSHDANDVTINSYLRAVRAFSYYCQENGWLVPYKVRLTKATKKTKETYSDAELEVLLKKPNTNTCTFTEFKIWAFENFLLGTGVRLSTALDIKIGDLDFDNGFIFLGTTKNRTQQYIPMAHSLEKIIKEYLEIRGGSDEDYLFCNNRGLKGNDRTYQQMVAKYNTDRDVNRTSIHAYRHTFAKLSILNGCDAFRLQKLMGHSDISVTKEYVDLFGQDLANGYDRFNPLDNLGNNGSTIRMR